MNITTIFRILGILLMIFSLSMFPPILIDFWYKELVWIPFIVAFALTLGTGFILWLPFRHQHRPLPARGQPHAAVRALRLLAAPRRAEFERQRLGGHLPRSVAGERSDFQVVVVLRSGRLYPPLP